MLPGDVAAQKGVGLLENSRMFALMSQRVCSRVACAAKSLILISP